MGKRSSDEVHAGCKTLHRISLLEFEQELLLKTNGSSFGENYFLVKVFCNGSWCPKECAGFEKTVSSGELSHLAAPGAKDKLFL